MAAVVVVDEIKLDDVKNSIRDSNNNNRGKGQSKKYLTLSAKLVYATPSQSAESISTIHPAFSWWKYAKKFISQTSSQRTRQGEMNWITGETRRHGHFWATSGTSIRTGIKLHIWSTFKIKEMRKNPLVMSIGAANAFGAKYRAFQDELHISWSEALDSISLKPQFAFPYVVSRKMSSSLLVISYYLQVFQEVVK